MATGLQSRGWPPTDGQAEWGIARVYGDQGLAAMRDYAKDRITECLKACLIAERNCRRAPGAYLSSPPSEEILRLGRIWSDAEAALWTVTDFEYAEDGFSNLVWEWRYWKVMARKCCWSQRGGDTKWAGETMASLGDSWAKLVEACGLDKGFMSSCDYLEEAFPNLR